MTCLTVSFRNAPIIYRREAGLDSAGSGQRPIVEYCEVGNEISSRM